MECRLGKKDPLSFAEPDKVTTLHTFINWKVDFLYGRLIGYVIHTFNLLKDNIKKIVLDVKDINIYGIYILTDTCPIVLKYAIVKSIEEVGAKLVMKLPEGAHIGPLMVKIDYQTVYNASGLKWLKPEETEGLKHPLMFSQCKAIHARSLMPCQDTPGVKFTYNACIEHPHELKVLMSAIQDKSATYAGSTTFVQKYPIPAYDLAIAVGNFSMRELALNCKLWTEAKSKIDAYARQLESAMQMWKLAKDFLGNFIWKTLELVVLPKHFPYTSMENPNMHCFSPIIFSADQLMHGSIMRVILHNWIGNQLGIATFEHSWLNESLNMFISQKLMAQFYGNPIERDFHMAEKLHHLQSCLNRQYTKIGWRSKIIIDFSKQKINPDLCEASTIKGCIFLHYLENLLGGSYVFDEFLKSYLKTYHLKTVKTADFRYTLQLYFEKGKFENQLEEIDWMEWLYGVGMPPIIPKFNRTLIQPVEKLAALWLMKSPDEISESKEVKIQLTQRQVLALLDYILDADAIEHFTGRKVHLLQSTYQINVKNTAMQARLVKLYINARCLDFIDYIYKIVNQYHCLDFNGPIYKALGKWMFTYDKTFENYKDHKNEMMAVCRYDISEYLGIDNSIENMLTELIKGRNK